MYISFFFFNDPPTTEIYTLSLHDALPICEDRRPQGRAHRVRQGPHERGAQGRARQARAHGADGAVHDRSEEHTSELQSLRHLVCRLLLEKKKKKQKNKSNKKNRAKLKQKD